MSEEILVWDRVVVQAAGRTLLQVDHLAIRQGEWVTLLGPNGAGKTTLLRAALGMTGRTSGTVRLWGHAWADTSCSIRRQLRRRVGYVPQLPPPPRDFPLTVREVVSLGRTARRGWPWRWNDMDEGLVDHWLAHMRLTSLADCRFAELSGGEQRRTLLARALAQQADLLLLDEPTVHLDPAAREELLAVVTQLRRDTPTTVVWVCHEVEMIPAACDRLVLLRAGRVIADGTPAAVLTSNQTAEWLAGGNVMRTPIGRWIRVPGGES